MTEGLGTPLTGNASREPNTSAIKADTSAFRTSLNKFYKVLTDKRTGTLEPTWDSLFFIATRDSISTAIKSWTTVAKGSVLQYDILSPYWPLKDAEGKLEVKRDTVWNKVLIKDALDKSREENDTISQVDYRIIRPKLDNAIVARHLKATKGFYKGWPASYDVMLDTLRRIYERHGTRIDAILVQDSLFQHQCLPNNQVRLPFRIEVVNELVQFYDYFSRTKLFYDKVLCDNQDWISRWLWYTGAKFG